MASNALLILLPEASGEVGSNQTRSNRVDAHRGCEFKCELLRQVDNRRLGDVVPPDARFGTETTHRRDVEDHATVFAHPLVPRRGGMGDNGSLIDLVRLLHSSVIDIDERAEIGVRAGVVDQDVEASELLDGLSHEPIGVFARTNVGNHSMNRRSIWKRGKCPVQVRFTT